MEENRGKKEKRTISLKQQFKCCMKSRNWVPGSYNDGYTQTLFYVLGQAPLGIGILLCTPVCKKFGRRNAMMGGFALPFIGVVICLLNPRNLVLVLAGQFIRTVGLIPSSFMISGLLGDALQAPTAAVVPIQNAGVQSFMIFCVIGIQAVAYLVILCLFFFFGMISRAGTS